jgi:cytosine/adenosine deaminase-related metal-dependent hydrolase
MHGAEKSADFLAADEWIKREWPKIIAEYSPEDTYNADETGIRLMLSAGYCYQKARVPK